MNAHRCKDMVIASRDTLDETCVVLLQRLKNCIQAGPIGKQQMARLAAQARILRDLSRVASMGGGARRARRAPDDDGSSNAAEVARHRPAAFRATKRSQGTARRLLSRTVPMEIILAVSDDLYDLDLPPDFGHERDRHNPGAAASPATPRSTSAPDSQQSP